MAATVRTEVARDIQRAAVYAKGYAARWVGKAEGETVAKAAAAASSSTIGSAKRIGITESSEAFNSGRAKALQSPALRSSLLRVWDAALDKRTCPLCSAADGTIVGIKESFPLGEPGGVHAHCRCTSQILTFEESANAGLILPKEDARVISLPVAKPTTTQRRIAPAVGYLTEQGGRINRAFAYARMVQSRVIPEAVKRIRGGATLKQLFAGIDEADLKFSRIGYRAPINPYEGVVGQKAVNDIATGRALPQGSRSPLPPITITKYPRVDGDTGDLVLTDGRHRLEAAQKAGATEIRAKIRFYDRELNVTWEGERVIPLPTPDPTNPRQR